MSNWWQSDQAEPEIRVAEQASRGLRRTRLSRPLHGTHRCTRAGRLLRTTGGSLGIDDGAE